MFNFFKSIFLLSFFILTEASSQDNFFVTDSKNSLQSEVYLENNTISIPQGNFVTLNSKKIMTHLQYDEECVNVGFLDKSKIRIVGLTRGCITQLEIFDQNEQRIGSISIIIGPELVLTKSMLDRAFKNSNIHIVQEGHSIVLSGTVETLHDKERLNKFLSSVYPDFLVFNHIKTRVKDHVALHINIISIDKNMRQALGVTWKNTKFFGEFKNTDYLGNTEEVGIDFDFSSGSTGIPFIDSNFMKKILLDLRILDMYGISSSISSPVLTAMHNKPATLHIGGEYTALVKGSEATDTITKEYGTKLDFTPQIISRDKILVDLAIESVSLSNAKTDHLDLNTRKTKSSLSLRPGQSFFLTGSVEHVNSDRSSGIPLLSSIPFIGNLFKGQERMRHDVEVLIIVTPYIVGSISDIQPGDIINKESLLGNYSLDDSVKNYLVEKEGDFVSIESDDDNYGFIVG